MDGFSINTGCTHLIVELVPVGSTKWFVEIHYPVPIYVATLFTIISISQTMCIEYGSYINEAATSRDVLTVNDNRYTLTKL